MKRLIVIAFLLVLAVNVNAKETNPQLLIINKSTNKMAYFDNGELVRIFDVATGRQPSFTPEGIFSIVNKIENRPYYTLGIPGGDPNNPLGPRWLGLDANGTYGTNYGIHGNSDSSSIGTYASAGCIRMNNDEVIWLFDQVKKFTPVIIVNSKTEFEELAIEYEYPLIETIIAKEEKVVTAFKEIDSFNKPNLFTINDKQSIRIMKAIEQTENFYHILSDSKDYWVKKEDVVNGRLEQQLRFIKINKETQYYTLPYKENAIDIIINVPFKISFFKIGNYHLIENYGKMLWVKIEKI